MELRKLLIAAVILAALSGAVWYTKQHPPSPSSNTPATPSTNLVNIPADSITAVDITRKDGTALALAKKDGKWVITAPTSYNADQEAVNSMTSSVSPAAADSVVDDKPSDPAKYGL